jgi:hypothetical protein
MIMKQLVSLLIAVFILSQPVAGQDKGYNVTRILFNGLVLDASNFSPVSNTQITINRTFSSVSGNDGTFAFYVNRNDTVRFKSLGYKEVLLFISDTLTGREFNAGIYMNSDTMSIGEVIIVPRFSNLKSQIMNAGSNTPETFDNARYNVALSGYQGRNSQNKLGDPADNYAYLIQKQKVDAFERGGIPSDKILGLNPLLIIPAAYMFIKGLPAKPDPLKPQLTEHEITEIQKKYLESARRVK